MITYSPYAFNYGMFPQTWEDPSKENPETKTFGDDDPLDVVEVGCFRPGRGEVVQVKVIGALALIDEGETDWKIITINIKDPQAGAINSIEDLDIVKRGITFAIRDFFVNYKTKDGKPQNKLGYGGNFLSAEKAHEIVFEHAAQYRALVEGKATIKEGKKYSLKRSDE